MNPENLADADLGARKTRERLRREAIARRLALSPERHAQLSARIRAHVKKDFAPLAALRVAFCWPQRGEPDLRPLIEEWLAARQAGFCALLPVVRSPGAALAFRAWRPESPMTIDRYGIPTPRTGEFITPEALLIPVNAFDAEGYRLGYGGGFFDRTLAALAPQTPGIGIGFELGRVASIRPQAHDRRLTAMVTEAGVFRFA